MTLRFEVELPSPKAESNTDDLDSMRQCQVWEAVTNNIAFMLTPFFMPSVFASGGWTFSLIFLLFSHICTFTSGIIIGEICIAYPDLRSYPDLGRRAYEVLAQRLFHASESTQLRFGAFGYGSVTLMQVVSHYLCSVCELIYLEQYLGIIFDQPKVCQAEWLLVATAMCAPFMQIPSFHESRWAALATLLFVILGILVFFYEVWLVQPWSCAPGPVFPERSTSNIMVGLTGIAFAYGGHGIFPEQIREMEKPESWPCVMRWTYAFATPCYLIMGVLGYHSYGDYSHANINENFPRNAANKLSVCLLGLSEFYYVYFTVLVMMLQVELSLGVDPSAWRTQAKAADCETSSFKEVVSLRRFGVPPWGFRLVFRSLFLAGMWAIARVLIAGDGGVLLELQAFSGALGMGLGYIAPFVFGWALLPPRHWTVQVLHGLAILLSTGVFCIGMYFTFLEVVDNTAPISEDVPCREYEYAYYGDDTFRPYGCTAALGPWTLVINDTLLW